MCVLFGTSAGLMKSVFHLNLQIWAGSFTEYAEMSLEFACKMLSKLALIISSYSIVSTIKEQENVILKNINWHADVNVYVSVYVTK